jgi:hypothetical protein
MKKMQGLKNASESELKPGERCGVTGAQFFHNTKLTAKLKLWWWVVGNCQERN